MIDDFRKSVVRKVWKHSNGSKLMTVSGLLDEGEYEICLEHKQDGTVVLECKPKDQSTN